MPRDANGRAEQETDADARGAGIDAELDRVGLPPLPRTAWLAIDLDRLTGNLRAIRATLPPQVRVEPVVKADAYGHGAVPVAHALAAAGADAVSVATWDEAVQLRDGGIDVPILVLYPVPAVHVVEAAERQIALAVGEDPLLARTLATWTARRPAGATLQLQLEIETGLGRGGVAVDTVVPTVRRIAATPAVELVGLWSHLGDAGDPARTGRQTGRFQDATGGRDEGWYASTGSRLHLAASGGILSGLLPHFDVVRPGLSTYGVLPDGLTVADGRRDLAAALRPVLSLRARPVRVADLPAGAGVSYGQAFVTRRPSRIATLPLGYADGFQRVLTNRAQALVRGQHVPLVGTVAMDAVMVDVTDVPPPEVSVDDEFVLVGDQGGRTIDAAELARAGTTISWEVLAGMARRLPRVYYAAARPVGLRTLTEDVGPWRRPVELPTSSVARQRRFPA